MESFLVYNTDEYELSDFILNITITDTNDNLLLEKTIVPDQVLIWMIDDNYGLIDMYNRDPALVNDIKTINNVIAQYNNIPINTQIKFYPSKEQENIYIELTPIARNSFNEMDRGIPENHYFSAQINVKSNMNIKYLDKEFESIKDSFENLTRTEAQLNDAELKFIQKTMEEQNSDEWYNYKKKKQKSNILANKIKFLTSKKPKTDNKVVVSNADEKIFDASSLKIQPGSLSPMEDLENIIGLDNVKHEIEKLKSTLEYKKERKNRGIEDNTSNSLHMCFYGSPGTGKTTIARIMTGLLYETGYIKENKCVEINGLEFKGGYVGQTEIITKGILDASQNGVLFVDEAYALCNGTSDAYGKEAVNTFIKEMEDNRDKLIVIFAGYEKDMESFLDMNSGFRSRINRYFKFENYSVIELTEILLNLLRKKHLKITEDALRQCMIIFKKAKQYHEFGNGRFVNNLLEKVEEQHMLNVVKEKDVNRQDLLTIDDITDKLVKDLFNTF